MPQTRFQIIMMQFILNAPHDFDITFWRAFCFHFVGVKKSGLVDNTINVSFVLATSLIYILTLVSEVVTFLDKTQWKSCLLWNYSLPLTQTMLLACFCM
jgi:hypothetical protein